MKCRSYGNLNSGAETARNRKNKNTSKVTPDVAAGGCLFPARRDASNQDTSSDKRAPETALTGVVHLVGQARS